MNGTSVAILDHMSALAEPTRTRILLLLEQHELTVSEVRAVLQLPQSTASRHLRALADSDWVTSRSEGTSNWYSMHRDDLDPAAERLWRLVREQAAASPTAMQDHRRLDGVLSERRTTSQEFFSSSAGQWDRLRDELFGQQFHLLALPGLVDADWTVGDLGCGTGQVAASLAPFVRRVIAVDGSAAMLEAARERLGGLDNVELRRGELESLPLDEAMLDAATLMLVLHHLPEPERVIVEVARVLRPGGRLLITDMMPHDRDGYRQQMGHVWLGFSDRQIERHLESAGFEQIRIHALPTDSDAKGPALFAATARRAGDSELQRGGTATPTTHHVRHDTRHSRISRRERDTSSS